MDTLSTSSAGLSDAAVLLWFAALALALVGVARWLARNVQPDPDEHPRERQW